MLALLALALAPQELPVDGWVAFEQPAVDGTTRMGCDDNGRATLNDDDHNWHMGDAGSSRTFEHLVVYIEMRDGVLQRLRAFTPDCIVSNADHVRRAALDAPRAVRLLSERLEASAARNLESRIIATLAHIDHADAGEALARIAADEMDEDRAQDAMFWLAARRGEYGRSVVTAHLDARWPLDHREHAVMALALSEHPEALAVVRDVARTAEVAELRAQAVVGLGITGAPGALAELHSIFLVDEDAGVREQAVFAIAQIENAEAARILADIVREPRNGELRRTALFWLAQMQGEDSQAVIDSLVGEIF